MENCELKQEIHLDSTEDIATTLIPLAEIPGLVANGRIGHSLVVVAFYHYHNQSR